MFDLSNFPKGAEIAEFTGAPGTTLTWYKPAGCNFVHIFCVGGGGGGGGGRTVPAGNFDGGGGGGGGSGGISQATFFAGNLPDVLYVSFDSNSGTGGSPVSAATPGTQVNVRAYGITDTLNSFVMARGGGAGGLGTSIAGGSGGAGGTAAVTADALAGRSAVNRASVAGNPGLAGNISGSFTNEIISGSLHTILGGCGGGGFAGRAGRFLSDVPLKLPSQPSVFGFIDIDKIDSSLHNLYIDNTSDKRLWAWGINSSGQCGIGTTASPQNDYVKVIGTGSVGFLTGVLSASAGGGHSVALTFDDRLFGWGANDSGQCGNGTIISPRTTPIQVLNVSPSPGFLSGVLKVAAGYAHTAVLTDTGVYCWGDNGVGQCGIGNTLTPQTTPQSSIVNLLSGFYIKDIAAGYGHTVILADTDSPVTTGSVYCWGLNGSGELGNNSTTTVTTFAQVKSPSGTGILTGAISIATSPLTATTCALMGDGTVFCWGANDDGQCGNNTTNFSGELLPVQVQQATGGFLTNVSQISMGGGTSQFKATVVAVKNDGSVWCWGTNDQYQCGDGSPVIIDRAVQVKGVDGTGFLSLTGTPKISAGYLGNFAIDTSVSGTLFGWGFDVLYPFYAFESDPNLLISGSNGYNSFPYVIGGAGGAGRFGGSGGSGGYGAGGGGGGAGSTGGRGGDGGPAYVAIIAW
jgi:alpha-tubulin suppressor-like RCC1 family protein